MNRGFIKLKYNSQMTLAKGWELEKWILKFKD